MEKEKRIKFLQKLKDLLTEYNAFISVDDIGFEYEGHLAIYDEETWEEIVSFEGSDYHSDILDVEMIRKGIEQIVKPKERKV